MGSTQTFGVDVKQAKMFRIDPENIKVNWECNGRMFPHNEDSLHDLAHSIARNGQRQPVQVRPVKDDETELKVPELVLGFGRYYAVEMINSGNYPELREIAGLKDGERMMLLARSETISDEQALLHNIAENSSRNATSVVDDAYNHKRLRESCNWSDDDIAEYYGVKPAWVNRLKNLLLLDNDTLRLLHEGYINVMDAISTKDFNTDERHKIIDNAKKENGKIDKKTFKDQVRQGRAKKGRRSSRTMSELREMLSNLQENDDAVVSRFATDMMRVVRGEIGEQGLLQAIKRTRDQEAYAESSDGLDLDDIMDESKEEED